MSEKRDNSGALFKNDTEGKSENFPGYGGSLTVEGVDYYISAWLKDGQRGKFFSLSVKRKDEAGKKGIQQAKSSLRDTLPDDGFQDDIPF